MKVKYKENSGNSLPPVSTHLTFTILHSVPECSIPRTKFGLGGLLMGGEEAKVHEVAVGDKGISDRTTVMLDAVLEVSILAEDVHIVDVTLIRLG